jgi:hypothetical protein
MLIVIAATCDERFAHWCKECRDRSAAVAVATLPPVLHSRSQHVARHAVSTINSVAAARCDFSGILCGCFGRRGLMRRRLAVGFAQLSIAVPLSIPLV